MGDRYPGFCAYCGRRRLVERDHVVPIGLFPPSSRASAKFVFRDACNTCNRGVSMDEEDLRNFSALAGTDFPEAKELFHGPMKRSFDRLQGKGPFTRMCEMMYKDDDLDRYRIKPGHTVFRALNKIVRGLTHNHFHDIVAERRVEVVVCPYEIPEAIIPDDSFIDVHPLVFRYWYHGYLDRDVHSMWVMRILQDRVFCGMVFP